MAILANSLQGEGIDGDRIQSIIAEAVEASSHKANFSGKKADAADLIELLNTTTDF